MFGKFTNYDKMLLNMMFFRKNMISIRILARWIVKIMQTKNMHIIAIAYTDDNILQFKSEHTRSCSNYIAIFRDFIAKSMVISFSQPAYLCPSLSCTIACVVLHMGVTSMCLSCFSEHNTGRSSQSLQPSDASSSSTTAPAQIFSNHIFSSSPYNHHTAAPNTATPNTVVEPATSAMLSFGPPNGLTAYTNPTASSTSLPGVAHPALMSFGAPDLLPSLGHSTNFAAAASKSNRYIST